MASDALHRELEQIAAEQRDAAGRVTRLEADLADAIGWEAVKNPETGEMGAKPIPRFSGAERAAKEAELAEQRQRLHRLHGVEGRRRLDKALAETVEAEQARRASPSIAPEARERLLRDERRGTC